MKHVKMYPKLNGWIFQIKMPNLNGIRQCYTDLQGNGLWETRLYDKEGNYNPKIKQWKKVNEFNLPKDRKKAYFKLHYLFIQKGGVFLDETE